MTRTDVPSRTPHKDQKTPQNQAHNALVHNVWTFIRAGASFRVHLKIGVGETVLGLHRLQVFFVGRERSRGAAVSVVLWFYCAL